MSWRQYQRQVSAAVSVGVESVVWIGARAQDVSDVKNAIKIAFEHATSAAREELGHELASFVDGIVPDLMMASGVIATCIVGGAVVGGATGALAGGAGAAPGAAAGALAGLGIGVSILNVLGLHALSTYVIGRFAECEMWLSRGITTTLGANGNRARIDEGGRQLAKGIGIFVAIIVHGLLEYATSRGKSAVVDLLRNSRLAGPGAMALAESAKFERAAKMQGYLNLLGKPRVPPLVRERVGIAVDFFESLGMNQATVLKNLKGIDFSRPVEIVEILPSMKLLQYAGTNIGHWFTRPGTPLSRLGASEGEAIALTKRFNTASQTNLPNNRAVRRAEQAAGNRAASTRMADRLVAKRQPVVGTMPHGARSLKSYAAPAADTWTTHGQRELRAGGGEQYFIPKKHEFRELGPRSLDHLRNGPSQ